MTAALSLAAALADPDLFAPLFDGGSWNRWRVFLRALFGEPLTGDELAIFRHHTERATPPTRPFREAAIICGRRSGKSRVLALLAVYLGAFGDYRDFLAPGEQPVIAIIAANRRQAAVLLRYVAGLLRAVPLLAPLVVDELAESVRLANGVVVEVHTGSIASPRGRTFIAVLADEIAFWPATEDAANPDAEVIAAVRPGLASIPSSLLLMASSPYWQKGVLFSTFRRHWGNDGGRVLVWRGTTAEMNETIDPAIIAEAYEEDPIAAAAEFGAQWRTDVDSYISHDVVAAAVAPDRRELPPVAGVDYAAFVDAASGSGADRMVLAIAHATAAEGIAVLDCLRSFAPPFSPDATVQEMAAVARAYRVTTVTGDHWALGWVGERFEAAGLRYEASDRTKSDIYRELLGPLNSGRVELLDHPQMIAELLNLERRVARGGRDSIDHPAGLHDDLINAAGGAIVLVAGHPRFRSWGFYELTRQRAASLGVVSAVRAGTWGTPHIGHPDVAAEVEPPTIDDLRCRHGVYPPAACRACLGRGFSRPLFGGLQ
jgi:hypothetical protein